MAHPVCAVQLGRDRFCHENAWRPLLDCTGTRELRNSEREERSQREARPQKRRPRSRQREGSHSQTRPDTPSDDGLRKNKCRKHLITTDQEDSDDNSHARDREPSSGQRRQRQGRASTQQRRGIELSNSHSSSEKTSGSSSRSYSSSSSSSSMSRTSVTRNKTKGSQHIHASRASHRILPRPLQQTNSEQLSRKDIGAPMFSSPTKRADPELRPEPRRVAERVEVCICGEQGDSPWMIVPLLDTFQSVKHLLDDVRDRVPPDTKVQKLFLVGKSGQPCALWPDDPLLSVIGSGDRIMAGCDSLSKSSMLQRKLDLSSVVPTSCCGMGFGLAGDMACSSEPQAASPVSHTAYGRRGEQFASPDSSVFGNQHLASGQQPGALAHFPGLQQTLNELDVILHPHNVTTETVFWMQFCDPPHWVLCLQDPMNWHTHQYMNEAYYILTSRKDYHVDAHSQDSNFGKIRQVLAQVCVTEQNKPQFSCVAWLGDLRVVGVASRFKVRVKLAKLALAVAFQLSDSRDYDSASSSLSCLVRTAANLLGEKLSEYVARHKSN